MSSSTSAADSKALPLIWDKVVEKYNISKQLSGNLQSTVLQNQNLIGMRLDGRDAQVVDRQFACKPSYVKYKTNNWGPMKGFIPYDQAFLAKTDNHKVKVGESTQETENLSKYAEIIGISTQKMTLQEINVGIARGEFEQIPDSNSNMLVFRSAGGNTPTGTEVVFRIDRSKASTLTSHGQEEGKDTANVLTEYPLEYQQKAGAEFQELKVYGRSEAGKFYPFSKDNDGFLSTMTKQHVADLPPACLEVINTMTKKHEGEMIDKMYEALVVLHMHFEKVTKETVSKEKMAEIFEKVDTYNIAGFGAGSAFDFYIANQLNNGIEANIFKYLQHSFEIYNPSKVSNINGDVLWIKPPSGEPAITSTAKEHAEFLVKYCDTQVFHVNPNWDMRMDMFGQVVQKQLQAGMPVLPETKAQWIAVFKEQVLNGEKVSPEAIVSFLKENNNHTLDDKMLQACVLQAIKSSGPAGLQARDSLYNYFETVCNDKPNFLEKSFRETMIPYGKLKASDPRPPQTCEGIQKVELAHKELVDRTREAQVAMKPKAVVTVEEKQTITPRAR